MGTVKSGLNGLISPEPSVLSTRSHVGGLVSNSPIKRTRQDFQSTAKEDKKWRKEIDVESGETYYVNNRTEESQWDRPISLPGTFRGDITPSQTPKHFSTGKKITPTNVQDQWESSIDEVTGERFYTSKVTGEAQWEVPEGFVEPKSLFSEFKKLDKPTSAASSLLRNMKGEKRLGYSESLRFSTAAGDDDLKKFREREVKRESQVETDVSAGMYEGGALGYILRQKKAAEMLQKYVRGRKARREMRQRLKEKDTWVKENAKRTGAYDDVFDRLRSRGAKIRTLDVWEQWLDSSGRIFYYNPLNARGQWVPPLCFERALQVEERSQRGARNRALKEDAAMRKLERNWENRTDVEVKWEKLELIQKDKMENNWRGNSWIRGIDNLRIKDSYSRDALEVESYRYVYQNLKKTEGKIDSEFEEIEKEALERKSHPVDELAEELALDSEDELNTSHDMKEVEADGKKYEQKRERFINTISRGVQDVNNPDMLRRAFVLRRGWGKCRHFMQLADPVTGFKFYKNKKTYDFQWEKPLFWDEDEDEEPEQVSTRRGSRAGQRRRSKSKKGDDNAEETVKEPATPQKIVLGIIGKNPKSQTAKLAKTRLNVQHFEPTEEDLHHTTAAQQRSHPSMTLTNLLEKASVKTFYKPHGREEGWLRDAVMDMYLDTQAHRKGGRKEHVTSSLPPVDKKSRNLRFMEGTSSHSRSASGEFEKCVKILLDQQKVDEADSPYGESLGMAMRYLESLPSVNTPRMALKMRRRTKQGSAPSSGTAGPFPFSHPSIHQLSPALTSIKNFARAYLLHSKISSRDLAALLAGDRASALSCTQFFDPTPTPHRMDMENDRLMSYGIPGGTSMVRSDTTLGAGPHATQRLVQLRDRGIQVNEVVLDEDDDASSEWVILMSKKGLWSGKTLPSLLFNPRRVEGAIDPTYYRGNRGKSSAPHGKIAPPPPPPRFPNPSAGREIYFLNKQNYSCQPGIPASMLKEKTSDDWKKTGRVARVGYGSQEVEYNQFVNSKHVVLYAIRDKTGTLESGQAWEETTTPEDNDTQLSQDEQPQDLTRIDPLGRIVFDNLLEEGLKSAFMRLNDLKGSSDVSGLAGEIAKLCRHRQFRHAEKALRNLNETIGISIEAEGEEKVDGEDEDLDMEMVQLAAAITMQIWWKGAKQRMIARGKKLAEKAKGQDDEVEVIVTKSGNKILQIRSAAVEGGGGDMEGMNLMSDLLEESAVSLSLDPDVTVLVDAAFDELVKEGVEGGNNNTPATLLSQIKVLTTINILSNKRDGANSNSNPGGEGTPLDRLAALLPFEGSKEMDSLFRNIDDTTKFDRVLFRNLFAYTNKLMKKKTGGGPEKIVVVTTTGGDPNCMPAEKTHIDYALSSRVSIARAWALVAAGDSHAAARAANTALQHVLKGSRMASQTGYDVEALILLSELIGVGLGDAAAQGEVLNIAVKSFPDNISVMNACGTFFVSHLDTVERTDAYSRNAVKFLGRCVAVADKAAQEAGGKGYMVYDRALSLYNLSAFELAHNHSVFQGEIWEEVGSKDSDNYSVPLVAIERKLRQAISLLAPSLEKSGQMVKVLYSKLNFLLAKILHTYKGSGSGQTAKYTRAEASRMYDAAAHWGSRSLGVAEGFEGDVSIGIHRAALLVNENKIVESEDAFLAALYGERHYVGPSCAGAWLVFGAFLEEKRGDLEGALNAYRTSMKMAGKGKEGGTVAKLALSQLEELVRADSSEGFKFLQGALSCARVEGGKVGVGALVSAAQYSSEVDGDVVTSSQLLEKALESEQHFGPALRWQGLLLARAGLYDDALSKLLSSCKWSPDGRLYSPGLRCAAMLTCCRAVEAESAAAREGKLEMEGYEDVAAGVRKAVGKAKHLLAKVVSAEPNCRWTNLACGLLQLCHSLNSRRAEQFLTAATVKAVGDGSSSGKFGFSPSEALGSIIPAEAFRTLARLQDWKGDKMSAVGLWKRCLVAYPGDRMATAGLATTMWGILKAGWSGDEEELTDLGLDLLDDWKSGLLQSIGDLFAAAVGSVSSGSGSHLMCTGPVPPECHALYAAYLQDELKDYSGALIQLQKSCKAWKVSLESREEQKENGAEKPKGLFVGCSCDVPSSVLYRLGRCSEKKGDLAAAEKFYTWCLEVPTGDAHARSGLINVLSWSLRDNNVSRRKYLGFKRRRKKWVALGGGDGADREYELALEEGLAFTARAYMLHSRVLKYARLRVAEVGAEEAFGGEDGGVLVSLVERGWEGRMLGKFASRDKWQSNIV
ncbi:hypothetical protein TL16_g07035 [Triparma laevis f. inornata]|uniref:WW domain-containing protein n=1 Tax=Triparma laevis f. inornata TaxID=1714386 RepID=A0A9W7ARD6_9STRA|nr:hypothetical protein TL16_g07035 [Triparma laevis f. inornata]